MCRMVHLKKKKKQVSYETQNIAAFLLLLLNSVLSFCIVMNFLRR